ncbi:MAG TPA: hypothetical protein VJX92_03450 [Methylomirabilota bacterium]|nr:hypothetical protein [Methylomirabilota bacterium]
MTEGKRRQAELADLLGMIERLAGELSLAEEPARFVAALDDAAPAREGSAGPQPGASP